MSNVLDMINKKQQIQQKQNQVKHEHGLTNGYIDLIKMDQKDYKIRREQVDLHMYLKK